MIQPCWRTLLYRIGLSAGIILLGYQFWKSLSGFSGISSNTTSIISVVVSILGILLALGIQVAAWLAIMRSLGVKLSASSAYGHYYLSFVSRYIPGSVWGYFSRAVWLRDYHQIPYSKTNIGSGLEIGAGLLSIVLMAAIHQSVSGSAPIRLLSVLTILLLPWVVFQIIKASPAWIKPDRDRWGLSILRDLRGTPFILSIYLLTCNWILYGIAIYLVGKLLGVELLLPGIGSLSTLPYLYSLAWLIGFIIIFLPSGLGVRELVLSAGLGTYLSVEPYQATAIAIMIRGIVLFCELLWLMINTLITRRSSSKAQRAENDIIQNH